MGAREQLILSDTFDVIEAEILNNTPASFDYIREANLQRRLSNLWWKSDKVDVVAELHEDPVRWEEITLLPILPKSAPASDELRFEYLEDFSSWTLHSMGVAGAVTWRIWSLNKDLSLSMAVLKCSGVDVTRINTRVEYIPT